LRLLRDLRGMALTNLLAGQQAPPFGRARLQALFEALATEVDADGKLSESFDIIFMTGWAPGPNQPSPARRGSGTQSLATALSDKRG
jgi:hypothetical protein